MSQESYTMPPIELGDSVYWYADGDRNQAPQPAIVTAIGFDTIALNILAPNTYNMRLRDGVRHVSDKRAKTPELQENGAWDYTPRLRRLMAIESKTLYGTRQPPEEGKK